MKKEKEGGDDNILDTVLAHGPIASPDDRRTSIYATDTPTSTRNNLSTMTPIEEALAAIELRKLGDDLI
jgi:hypothetical protein